MQLFFFFIRRYCSGRDRRHLLLPDDPDRHHPGHLLRRPRPVCCPIRALPPTQEGTVGAGQRRLEEGEREGQQERGDGGHHRRPGRVNLGERCRRQSGNANREGRVGEQTHNNFCLSIHCLLRIIILKF